MSVRQTLLLVLSVALVVSACRNERRGDQPDIVFILIDTLRADHLGTYGYPRATSPFIDGLAEHGSVFEKTIAQAPWTAPSMASLWTSRMPSEVGVEAKENRQGIRNVRDKFVTGMREDAITLAELLSAHGYITMAVLNNAFASQKFFILQGFAVQKRVGGNADAMFPLALGQLDKRPSPDAPVFLYVHLVDVHHPTGPPPPYDQMFETLDGRPHTNQHKLWGFQRGKGVPSLGFQSFRSHKLALYDGALRFIDDQFKNFRSGLRSRGFGSNTIFVVASDHGEEFWEHVDFQCRHHLDPRQFCGIGHGHSMSREVLHVPLIISGPGVPTKRFPQQVRNLDIAPTLLALAGVREIPKEMRGSNLFGGSHAEFAFSEDIAYGANARAIQNATHKLVQYEQTKSGTTSFLYAKANDGSETPIEDPAVRARLERVLSGKEPAAQSGRNVEMDEDTLRALRALGYVE